MSKIKYFLLCGLLLTFYGCGKNSTTQKTKETVSAFSNLAKMAKEAQKVEKNYDNLVNATPLSNDELKAWMPEQLMGMKRTSYSIGSGGYINLTSLDATYSNSDESKKIKLNLIDGADSLAAGVIGLVRMALAQNFERVDENSVEKTMKKDDIKAIVKYQKDHSRSSLKLLVKNRFLLTLEGTNESVDALWEAIDRLDVDELGP